MVVSVVQRRCKYFFVNKVSRCFRVPTLLPARMCRGWRMEHGSNGLRDSPVLPAEWGLRHSPPV